MKTERSAGPVPPKPARGQDPSSGNCKPGFRAETETEHLRRVSLTGGGGRTGGFCGAGMFPSEGPSGKQPIRPRVAYWSRGVGPKGGGEPAGTRVKRLWELAEGCWRPGGVRGRAARGAPAAPVEPSCLGPLTRGLPDALKMHVQSLRGRIRKAVGHSRQNPHLRIRLRTNGRGQRHDPAYLPHPGRVSLPSGV